MKQNALKRALALTMALVLLLSLVPGAALAADDGGWFYFSASTDRQVIAAPEKISYQAGETILQALQASGHSFSGIESGWVDKIDGVDGNFSRTDENGGYTMDRPAAEIRYFCFSEQEDFLSEGRMALIAAMADYLDETTDVRSAAQSEYDAALASFAGASDGNAQRLADGITKAVEDYRNAQQGEGFRVWFTDETGDAYTPENYPGVGITAVNAFGRTFTDEDGDGMLRLVAGDYTFSVVQGYCRIDGSMTVSGERTVSAVLPSGDWMAEGARISLSSGERFEEAELEVQYGDHTMRVTVPDDYAAGSYYLLAYYNTAVFSTTPKLYAYYTKTDGTVISPETNYNSSNRAWDSKYTSVSGVLSAGPAGAEVVYRVAQQDENGYTLSQEYTLYLDRELTLSGLHVYDQNGTGQGATESFSPHQREYTYRILSTVTAVTVEPEAFREGYAVTVNGAPLAETGSIPVENGTEITVALSKNGCTGSYTLRFVQAAGKSITFNTTGEDVDVSVYNRNGEKMLSVKERQTSGFYAYRYTLVPGETYTYIATQDAVYHAMNTFTLEESANSTVSVAVKTEDWLESLEFAENSTMTSGYSLDQAFRSDVHAYTLQVQDRKSAIYAKAAANTAGATNSVVYSKISQNASSNGAEHAVGLTASAKKLPDALMSNALGNTLTVRATLLEDGITYYQDYIITVERTLTLDSLSAKYAGAALLLEPDYSPDLTKYSVTVPMGARSLAVTAALRSGISMPFGQADAGYYVLLNGEKMASDTGMVELNGTDETETVVIGVRSAESPDTQTDLTLTVKKVPPVTLRTEIEPENALLVLHDTATGERLWPDETGAWSLSKGFRYRYVLTAPGYIGVSGTLCIDDNKEGQTVMTRSDGTETPVFAEEQGELSAVLALTLAAAPENSALDRTMESEWADFRGTSYTYDAKQDALVSGGTNYTNNGITDVKMPISAADSTLYWASKLGDGYSGKAVGCPILVDGDLITYSERSIYRVDAVSGQVLAKGSMCEASSFAITPPTYYEGMVFVGLSGGRIQAFDAKTLRSLWVYRDEKGGQPNCPLVVYDGYLYTGFWQGETLEANFVCLSVTDEDPADTMEAKLPTWTHTHGGGFYWAGAYVCDDFVLVGADDGQSSYTNGQHVNKTGALLLFDRKTGRVLDRRGDLMADVRSSICYDAETDAYYFTTKGGYFYRARMGKDDAGVWKITEIRGLQLDNYAGVEKTPAMSTCTPVVYKGRAYIGISGTGQFTAYSGHNLTVIDLGTWSIAYKVRTQGYPQTSGLLTTAYYEDTGCVYVYFFDNFTPGKLRMLKDSAGQTAPQFLTKERYSNGGTATVYDTPYALFTPAGDHAQYAICSPIVDEYGTVYFKNDSAFLMAFGSSIERLEVTAMPAKTEYALGETFDPTGMAVTAHYKNGASRDVTRYVTFNTQPLTAEDAEFAITFPYAMYHNENGTDGSSEAGVTTLKPHVNIMLTLTDRPAVTLGDVNGDGRADNLDAALVYAYYNGKQTLSEQQLTAADVNGDGKTDNLDAALIYAFYNGKCASFPAEQK